MSQLLIRSGEEMGPLEVSVYPPEGDPIEFTLSSGMTEHAVAAEMGRYTVVARRPNGARLRRTAQVRDRDLTILLSDEVGSSPNEFMTAETYRGQVERQPEFLVTPWRARLGGSPDFALQGALLSVPESGTDRISALRRLPRLQGSRRLSLHAWRQEGGSWMPLSEDASAGLDPGEPPALSSDFLKVFLWPARETRWFGLLDVDGFGPIVCVPPFSEPVNITFLSKGVHARAADRTLSPGGKRVPVAIVTSRHAGVADFLAALASPATPAAEAIWSQTATTLPTPAGAEALDLGPGDHVTAIRMMLEKFSRPAEALLAAHYLLRFLPARLPVEWADNLALALPEAADGPAIAAWARIQNGPEGISDADLDEIVERRITLALSRPVTLFARTRLLLAEARHLVPDAARLEVWAREEAFRRHGADAGGVESFWGGDPGLPNGGSRDKPRPPAIRTVLLAQGAFVTERSDEDRLPPVVGASPAGPVLNSVKIDLSNPTPTRPASRHPPAANGSGAGESRMSKRVEEMPTPSEIARPIIRHGEPLRGGISVKPPGQNFTAARFGRLFPDLDGLDVADDAIEALGLAMVEGGNNKSGDNANIPAGFTYLGQFIDHDITLDTTGIADRIKDVDQVLNFRTPRLDLDCVYGMGPGASPQLYDRRKKNPALSSACMLIGRTSQGFVGPEVKPGIEFDLPRSAQGRAIIGDHRNDENLLVSQTHLAFLLFHNAVARANPGMNFVQVRQQVTWHYQWMVLHDFLGKLVDMNDIATSLAKREFFRFEQISIYNKPYIPVEFSVAAYRLGHSMVRAGYSHNRVFSRQPFLDSFIFSGLSGNIVGDLANGRGGMVDGQDPPIPNAPVVPSLPSDWVNDWRQFFDFGSDEGQQDGLARNRSRSIDPYLIDALHDLPGGRKGLGVDLASHPSLAVRNLARGVKMQLPSGQAVAERMKLKALSPEEIRDSGDDGKVAEKHGLHKQTPLWYYILKEAQIRQKSERLGPVGSRILAEVFVGLLQGDPESFIQKHPGWTMANPTWKPTIGPNPGSFSMTDMLRFTFGSGGPGEDVALSPVDVVANHQVPPPPPGPRPNGGATGT